MSVQTGTPAPLSVSQTVSVPAPRAELYGGSGGYAYASGRGSPAIYGVSESRSDPGATNPETPGYAAQNAAIQAVIGNPGGNVSASAVANDDPLAGLLQQLLSGNGGVPPSPTVVTAPVSRGGGLPVLPLIVVAVIVGAIYWYEKHRRRAA